MTEAAGLFELAQAADEVDTILTVPLAQRYGMPPFSVLNRHSGHWQARKKVWNKIGFDSGAGRAKGLLLSEESLAGLGRPGQYATLNSTSVFDPVLCEVAYSWFSGPEQSVLDPFTGGSVRGIVASRLDRHYTGLDLSLEQVEANRAQVHLADPDHLPVWHQHDGGSGYMLGHPEEFGLGMYDMVFSCPPYFDLEQYSDGPNDLSGMTYGEFLAIYGEIIDLAVARLRPNRFAAWVISDVRDKQGKYRGLVKDTIQAFEDAGARLYNDLVIVDPVGSVAVRAGRPFDATRKVARLHQHMLVFVKGDPKVCATELNTLIESHGAVDTGAGEPALF